MARSTRPCFPPHPLSPARTGHCRGPASHQARNVRNSPYRAGPLVLTCFPLKQLELTQVLLYW